MRLCKNCAHYRREAGEDQCMAVGTIEYDVVDGSEILRGSVPCRTMRAPRANCGPDAGMFTNAILAPQGPSQGQ